ncbi:hypothetical protein [Pseudaestuariivita atlantica]|uniref:Uncharacterized protein n=1 Tax=Pseudaestuariivita atlantica TaxID=1317121 RepID=A0A0L1JU20_9RHOB|nr:hypothetical protein [Pseudaestuariivita atlantica]KNG94903.1 hypothetical protein ATO11_05925 [Pseudaestuariivita atlantica]
MILALILSIVAGAGVRIMEPVVRDTLKNVTLMDLAISDGQYDMLTLMLLLLAVIVLCTLFGIPTPAFLIVLGATVGVFGKQILDALRDGTAPGDRP